MRDHPIQCPDDLEDREALFYPDIDSSCPVRDFDHFSDKERAEYDFVHGHNPNEKETVEYENHYGKLYAQSANQEHRSEQ